jgi:hypothetical protein
VAAGARVAGARTIERARSRGVPSSSPSAQRARAASAKLGVASIAADACVHR